MDELRPSLTAEKEALREAYAALNRNDIPGFVKILDPQIERIEPAESPGAGTYHGLEVVKSVCEKLMAPRWAAKGPNARRRTEATQAVRVVEVGQRSRRAFCGPPAGRRTFRPHSASLLLAISFR
jgi:hypothetical protein